MGQVQSSQDLCVCFLQVSAYGRVDNVGGGQPRQLLIVITTTISRLYPRFTGEVGGEWPG